MTPMPPGESSASETRERSASRSVRSKYPPVVSAISPSGPSSTTKKGRFTSSAASPGAGSGGLMATERSIFMESFSRFAAVE